MDVGFLVQLADRGRRDLSSPKSFGNILYAAYRDAGEVHLDECFFHAAFSAAVALDDCSLKRHSLEPRHMQRHVSGGRSEITVIVAAAVALARLVALVTGGLS